MKLSKIKTREEFVEYITERQLEGKKADDDTQEKIIAMCEKFSVPRSVLRMHKGVCKKK